MHGAHTNTKPITKTLGKSEVLGVGVSEDDGSGVGDAVAEGG